MQLRFSSTRSRRSSCCAINSITSRVDCRRRCTLFSPMFELQSFAWTTALLLQALRVAQPVKWKSHASVRTSTRHECTCMLADVTITGAGFLALTSSIPTCRLGNDFGIASILDDSRISCVTPALASVSTKALRIDFAASLTETHPAVIPSFVRFVTCMREVVYCER